MKNYSNFYTANQLHGSANAPIGIILCKSSLEHERIFAVMNLPNRVMIVHTEKGNTDKEPADIDPNAKIY